MSNRNFITYYGEYSLFHWLEMILSQEITLPDFQRYFVWDPKRAIRLMESFDKGMFVPPVIIANFSGDSVDEKANYILDGQQRLSAILLTYLGVFPARFSKKELYEYDVDEEETIIKTIRVMQNWDFRKIQALFNSKCKGDLSLLKKELEKDNNYLSIDTKLKKIYNDTNKEDIELYEKLNIDLDFLKNKFLGYSYIKSVHANSELEKRSFSKIFKNINTSSVKLRHDESRAALYWISTDKRKFFQPDFINIYKVHNDKIDFTRYLALLSNANKLIEDQKHSIDIIYNDIAVGYARKRRFEDYIIDYVNSVIDDSNSPIFGKFSEIFSDYYSDFRKLESILNTIIKNKTFNNAVVAEFYLFGLFYWVLFKKCNIKSNIDLSNIFNPMIKSHIDAYNNKNLNRIGATRERIKLSIDVYSKLLENNDDN